MLIYRFASVVLVFLCASSALAETGTSVSSPSTAVVCARVEEVRIVNASEGQNPYPYLIQLTVQKHLLSATGDIFKDGRVSEFRIHSPARTFGDSADKIQGRIFRIEFLRGDKRWVLEKAAEDSDACGK